MPPKRDKSINLEVTLLKDFKERKKFNHEILNFQESINEIEYILLNSPKKERDVMIKELLDILKEVEENNHDKG